jgi:hypothetical protein
MKRVVCKDNSSVNKFLTEGQCYECVDEIPGTGQFPGCYAVIDNLGKWHMFEMSRFEYAPYYEKPPLGLMPRKIWNQIRFKELVDAIDRYIKAKKDIPYEWIAEYNEYISK